MGRIKKIKVKKSDGTFTDYLPLGSDAEYIDLENGNNLQEEINHITKSYNNVAAMKADETLKAGDICQTLGYYEENDGGNGLYKIVNNNILIDDGGSIHDLNNGLQAQLIVKDKINVKQFGVYGDGIHDDTTKLQQVIYYGSDISKKIYLPNGNYIISSTLQLVTSNNDIRKNQVFDIEGESTKVEINKPSESTIKYVFDTTYVIYLRLTRLSSQKLQFTIVPSEIYSQGAEAWSKWISSKEFIFQDIYVKDSASEGYGLALTSPAPITADRYSDKNYSRYPLYISCNSGYDAIEINNFGYNETDNQHKAADNSAIGIIDYVSNSNGIMKVYEWGDRPFLQFLRNSSSVKSSHIPGTVFEVSKNGHIAIGCTGYWDDADAKNNTDALKIRDNSPAIAFFDANNPKNPAYANARLSTSKSGIDNTEHFQIDAGNGNIFVLRSDGQLATTIVQDDRYNNNYNYILKIIYKKEISGELNTATRYLHIGTRGQPLYGWKRTDEDPALQMTNTYKSGTDLYYYQIKGYCLFNEDLGKPMWYNGTNWVDAMGTPITL